MNGILCFVCFWCQVQSMEGEREKLNRRILVLTEQLADAKFANSVETLNVRYVPSFEIWQRGDIEEHSERKKTKQMQNVSTVL